MSSITADFNQRDELPVFLAILLHFLAAGLVFWYVTASPPTPQPIRITDLPLSIGQMLAQQQPDEPPVKKQIAEAAKSEPSAAQTAQRRQAQSSQPAELSARVPNAAATTAIAQPDAKAADAVASKQPDALREAAKANSASASATPSAVAKPSSKVAGAALPALRLVAPTPRESPPPSPPSPARATANSVAVAAVSPTANGQKLVEAVPDPAKTQIAAIPPPQATEKPVEARPLVVPPNETQAKPPVSVAAAPEPKAKAPETLVPEKTPKVAPSAKIEPPAPSAPAVGPTARIALPAAPAPLSIKAAQDALAKSNPQALARSKPDPASQPDDPKNVAKSVQPETRTADQFPEAPVPPPRSPQPAMPKQPPAPAEEPGAKVADGGKREDKGAAQAAALSQLGKIGGLGKVGAADGTAGGSETGIRGGQESFEARGSAIAQACLNNAGTFLPIDDFVAVFPTRIDGTTRVVTITGSPKISRGSVATATNGRIEQALSRCDEFQRFVLTQSSVREFHLQITSSSLTSGR